jgi:hypothetical protein
VQTVDGAVVWSGRARRAADGSGRLASVRVPGSTLAADDYVVVIAAAQQGERERYALRLLPR